MPVHSIVALLLAISSATSTHKAESRRDLDAALEVLFPGARWKGPSPSANQETDQRLQPILRNGLKGYIPYSSASLTRIEGSLAAIAFELYLADPSSPAVEANAEVPKGEEIYKIKGALKVIGLVLFDLSRHKLIGKFPGFPMEHEAWACLGDVCSVPYLPTVEVGPSDPKGQYLAVRVPRQMSSDVGRFYRLSGEELSAVSDFLHVGDKGGEAECGGSMEYELERTGERVMLRKTPHCDPRKECAEDCRHMGLDGSFSLHPLPYRPKSQDELDWMTNPKRGNDRERK